MADRFAKTHYINPLPAFDDNYELILPQAYEAKIVGAVVHVRFTINRFDIRDTRIFVCNIVELQVLKQRVSGVDEKKRRSLASLMLRKKKERRVTVRRDFPNYMRRSCVMTYSLEGLKSFCQSSLDVKLLVGFVTVAYV